MTLKMTTIDGIKFSFINEGEFRYIYEKIFVDHAYRFVTNTSSPFIVDCGAHIGVSVLYFKTLYPQSAIIAFEPNPETFQLLELNIRQNDLNNVKLINAAIADVDTEIDFYVCEEEVTDSTTWAWGFAGVKNIWYNPTTYRTIKLPAVKLSSYIDRDVDFLKFNIEGMEEIVLKEIEHKLPFIKKLRIDFHGSTTNEHNNLERIFGILEERNGLSIAVTQDGKRINIDQIRKTDPYWLTIFISRQSGGLW